MVDRRAFTFWTLVVGGAWTGCSDGSTRTETVDVPSPLAAPVITSPTTGEAVQSPIVVAGTGKAGVDLVVEIYDGAAALAQAAGAVDAAGAFSIDVTYPDATPGTLLVVRATLTNAAGTTATADVAVTQGAPPKAPIVIEPIAGLPVASALTVTGFGEPGAAVTLEVVAGAATAGSLEGLVGADGGFAETVSFTDQDPGAPLTLSVWLVNSFGTSAATEVSLTQGSAPKAPLIITPVSHEGCASPLDVEGHGEPGASVALELLAGSTELGSATGVVDGWGLFSSSITFTDQGPDTALVLRATLANVFGTSSVTEVPLTQGSAPAAPIITSPPANLGCASPLDVEGHGQPGVAVALQVLAGAAELGSASGVVDDLGLFALSVSFTDQAPDTALLLRATLANTFGTSSPTEVALRQGSAPAAPVITSPSAGQGCESPLNVEGQGEPGASVALKVLAGSDELGTATGVVDGLGHFASSVSFTDQVPDTALLLRATLANTFGTSSPTEVALTQGAAPGTAVVDVPAAGLSLKSPLVVAGTAEPMVQILVELFEGVSSLGTAETTSDATGAFAVSLAFTDQAPGTSLTLRVVAANDFGSSTPTEVVVVQGRPPAPPVVTTPVANIEIESPATVAGLGPAGATIDIEVIWDTGSVGSGSAEVASDGTFSLDVTYTDQEPGQDLTVRATLTNPFGASSPTDVGVRQYDPLVEFRTTLAAGASENPSLVLAGGDAVLAWQDARTGADEIYFKRIHPAEGLGPPVRVTDGGGTHPEIAYDAEAEQFGVIWYKAGVNFARLYPNGARVIGSETVVSEGVAATTAATGGGDLVWTGSEWGVAWHHFATDADVYFARLAPDGTRQDDPLLISDASNVHYNMSLVHNGTVYGLAWVEGLADAAGVRFATIDASNTVTSITVEDYATADIHSCSQPHVDAAWSGTEFALVWQCQIYWFDYYPWQDYTQLFFARVDAAGTKVGETVHTTLGVDRFSPRIAWDAAKGHWVVAFREFRDGSTGLFLANVDLAGNFVGDDMRLTSLGAAVFGAPSELVVADTDTYGMAFVDTRHGNSEIYGVRARFP